MTEREKYLLWMDKVSNEELLDDLRSIENNEEEIVNRFFQDLKFGTAGLRGKLGAGTAMMNIYNVGLAAYALATFVKERDGEKASVAIGYDSRNKSTDFAKLTAAILAENGVKAYLLEELEPTPVVSYAVRELGCSSGVVITASHNPAEYNGFKCYDPRGYQMTEDDAKAVEARMKAADVFAISHGDFEKSLAEGKIEMIGDELMDKYLNRVLQARVNTEVTAKADLKVIYTPLCGAGNKPVREILKRSGVENVTVVPSQELPDGNFTTCKKPNPELTSAFDEAFKLAETTPADIIIATDPDCDRIGVAVNVGGEYKLLTGNETGVLLLDYMLSQKKAQGKLPENPVIVRTVPTSSLADRVSADYGCSISITLVGFKYIGEIVTELESKGEAERFVLGFEESYGYLAGTHARDKDAVVASMLICEMASFHKLAGKNLFEVLEGIYARCGACLHKNTDNVFEGKEGKEKIASLMDKLRANSPKELAGSKVVAMKDYLDHTAHKADGSVEKIDLPSENVLEFELEDGSKVIARPSGTEPKIKFYFTAYGACQNCAKKRIGELITAFYEFVGEPVPAGV